LIGFPKYWDETFKNTEFAEISPHLLRHSFASIAHDLGFTEVTIAALLGHSLCTITSRYIHTIDAALVMAADTVAGYIQGLLDGISFKRNVHSLDRSSREAALARLFDEAKDGQPSADPQQAASTYDTSTALFLPVTVSAPPPHKLPH
jgi:site-specific recombinase XerD